MGTVEDTWAAITSGDTLSDRTLRDLAQNLPSGYAITYTFAGEIGPDGLPLNGGVEIARTWVYDSQGGRTGMTVGAITGGTADGLPVEGAVEIGIAFLGDSGASSISGWAATAEGGYITGGGVTVPIRFADYAIHATEAWMAASRGDSSFLNEFFEGAPEGSVVFVSNGLQGGAGWEVGYAISDGHLSALLSNPNYTGPETFSGEQYGMALAYVEGYHGPATITWTFSHENSEYTVTQHLRAVTRTRDGSVLVNSRTSIVGPDGEPLNASEVRDFGFSPLTEKVWIRNGGFVPSCFGSETPIDMWPLDPTLKPGPDSIYDQDEVRAKVWKKPIEQIEVGDIVVSFDDNDNLVPGPVTRTFQNDAKILLDFHGTRVTPGHVYYRADSKKSYKYETLIDVLRDDGVIKHQDGTLIRAATNVPLGSPRDGFVQAVTQTRKADGTVVQNDAGRIRLGTRFLVGAGKERKSWAVADLIEAGGGVVGDDELIRVGDGEPMPFLWNFGETLPNPEDFVLSCSGTTLEDIYKAAEWESQGPRLPAPMVLDRGPVQPLKGAALSAMPCNEPLDVMHSPVASAKPQRTLNRKQRKAMEAKKRKAAKSRKRIAV